MFFGFLLGLIVGTLWTSYPFKFDTTISIANVLQLLTTILIAFFLQQVIQERYRNLRIEKDLLIGSAKEAQVGVAEAYKLCSRAFVNGKIERVDDQQILASFRQLSNRITTLKSFSNECVVSIDPKTFRRINYELLDFKKKSTGGTYPNKPYTITEIGEQGTASTRLHDRLNRFIVEVNRSHKRKKGYGWPSSWC